MREGCRARLQRVRSGARGRGALARVAQPQRAGLALHARALRAERCRGLSA